MKISKLKIVFKWIFGGVEGVVDYVLGVLNSFLASESVSEKAGEALALAEKVLGYLVKYADWCPSKWRDAYNATLDAVSTLVAALSDMNVTKEEAEKAADAFKVAYAEWIAE